MKLINLSIAAVVTGLCVTSVNAATVIVTNVQSGTGDTIYTNANGTLLDGGIVTIGHFSESFDVTANLGNIPTLVADFTVLTSALAGSASASLLGSFPGFVEQSATTDLGAITDPNALIGRGLYSFIGSAGTLATSLEVGLLFLQNIVDDNPVSNDYNSNPNGLTPLIGSTGSYTGNASGLGNATHATVQLAAVPEPSTLLLSALGVLALLRRKR